MWSQTDSLRGQPKPEMLTMQGRSCWIPRKTAQDRGSGRSKAPTGTHFFRSSMAVLQVDAGERWWAGLRGLGGPWEGAVSLSSWESSVAAFGTRDVLGVGGRQVACVSAGAPGLGPSLHSHFCGLQSRWCAVSHLPCAWHMGSPPRTSDRPKLSLTHSRC